MTQEAGDPGVTAIGLFHLGDDFLRAARALEHMRSLAKGPIRLLGIHASELYLKAYLRRQGLTHDDLASTMHNLSNIARLANDKGLGLNDDLLDRLKRMTKERAYMGARYELEDTDRSATSAASALYLASALRSRVQSSLGLDVPL